MKGEWVLDEVRQDWHLISYDPWAEGDDDAAAVVVASCGRVVSRESEHKPGAKINGLFDAVHDECYRQSEE